MNQGEFIAGYFTPLEKPQRPERPPRPPIELPPLPPGMPPSTKPIDPDASVEHPIFIPEEPSNPIQLPPGFVWPPFDPSDAIAGKALLLVWVPGTGMKWIVVEVPQTWPPIPGIPQPKR